MRKRRHKFWLWAFGLVALVLLSGLAAAACGASDQPTSAPISALAVQPSSVTTAGVKAPAPTTTSSLSTTTVSATTTATTPQATTTEQVTTTTAQATSTTVEVTTTVTETTTTTESGSGITVYITKTGTKYHRAGCSSLSKSKIPMSLEEAKAEGYEPCKRCKPPT